MKVVFYMKSGNSFTVDLENLKVSGNVIEWINSHETRNKLVQINADQIEAIVRDG